MIFTAFVLCSLILLKLKTEGQTIYRKLTAKLQNSNQNLHFSWVLSGFEQLSLGAPLLGSVKSMSLNPIHPSDPLEISLESLNFLQH